MYVRRRSHACGAGAEHLDPFISSDFRPHRSRSRLLCSLSSPTSDARGVHHLVWPLPLLSGLCLYAFYAELEGLSERAAIYDTSSDRLLPLPWDETLVGKYIGSSLLQPLVDSSTTNTPIVSRRLTALTTSTPIFLTPSGYCRRPAPASSCDRHVRIAAYETHASHLECSSQQQQYCSSASGMSTSEMFFVLPHTARQLQASKPASKCICCAISRRRPMRRASWAERQPHMMP